MVLILILLGSFTLNFYFEGNLIDENRTVFIKRTDDGFQIFRNGEPFYIIGASGNTHLKELADIGGNTIRVYDTINIRHNLDEAHENNLAVIVDIPLPQYNVKYNSYLSNDTIENLKQSVKDVVNKFSGHPAVLMWNLGNELKYPFTICQNSFIRTFNELIDIIHKLDPNHPVCTTIDASVRRKEIASIYLHSPAIDLLSINVFGNIVGLNSRLSQISFLFGPRPYYISEWGPDGFWESELTSWRAPIEPTSTKKAEQIRARYKMIKERNDGACLGSLVFFWGQKQEMTPTWFSIFDDMGRKSQSYHELKNVWKSESDEAFSSPQISHMLVDQNGARSNLVFKPNELKVAKIYLNQVIDSTIQFKWEIQEEGWNYKGGGAKHKINKILSNCFEVLEDSVVTFRVPAIEGPYRIFAYVYDKNGNFSTTNVPFYVLNPYEKKNGN